MMENKPKLITLFPEWYVGIAIFNALKTYVYDKGETYEWLDANNMDIEYIGSRSGNKPISVLVNNLIQSNITDIGSVIAPIIYNKFIPKWNNLFTKYQDILNNSPKSIDLTTIVTPNITIDTTNSSTDKNQGTITDDKSYSEELAMNRDKTISTLASDDYETTEKTSINQERETSKSNQDSTFGFNSTSSVPSDESNGTETETIQGSLDDNVKTNSQVGGFIETETMNADSNKDSKSGTDSNIKTLDTTNTKEGNIKETETGTRTTTIVGLDGKKTLVELTQEQIDFLNRNFYDIVYSDVDTLIISPYYDLDLDLLYNL